MTLFTKLALGAALVLVACTTEPQEPEVEPEVAPEEIKQDYFAPVRVGSLWVYSFSYANTEIRKGTYSLLLMDTLGGMWRFRYRDSMQVTPGYSGDSTESKRDTVVQVGKGAPIVGMPSPFVPASQLLQADTTRVFYQGDSVPQYAIHASSSGYRSWSNWDALYIEGVGLISRTQSDGYFSYRANTQIYLREYKPGP